MSSKSRRALSFAPVVVSLLALGALILWWRSSPDVQLQLRIPGTDAAPEGQSTGANPVLAGQLLPGPGIAADLPGDWPQFRGPQRDGRAPTSVALSRDWQTHPPRELWSLEVGEGYAGVAVHAGRVYLLDYDRDARQSALRCLSLADGRELWRFAYPLALKRNHGMTRTVPVVAGQVVVALDSLCNVLCLDAVSGQLKWTRSLVREFGATVPEWYAGQCPLVEGDRVILAPGGPEALLLAVDLPTGELVWQTPNPRGWKMTHSSIMPMNFSGQRQFLYCASGGVVGVNAADGALLWEFGDWRISIANIPTPVPLPEGRIFFTGGYNAGSLLAQLVASEGTSKVVAEARLPANVFGATQHTPILKDDHLYGVRADGRFVCLDLAGKVVWASGPADTFGLGAYLMAGDLVFAVNDSGRLSLIEATPSRFHLLGQAQVLHGREAWGPMALVGQRLLLRDLTRLTCLDLASR